MDRVPPSKNKISFYLTFLTVESKKKLPYKPTFFAESKESEFILSGNWLNVSLITYVRAKILDLPRVQYIKLIVSHNFSLREKEKN